MSYGNEFHVYFPTIKDSMAREYGAAMNGYVGLGAGHTLVTQSLSEIGRIMGALSSDPSREDFVLLEGGPGDEAPN